MRSTLFTALIVAISVAVAAGCGDSSASVATLIAATSLKQAIEPLVAAYNERHGDIKIRSSFAPSDQIQRQIEGGYDADLIFTASGEHMQPLVDARLATGAKPFASNTMIVAVGNHAKGKISAPHDLAGDVRISMGDSTVPVGKYGQQTIDALEESYGNGYAKSVDANVVNRAGSAADVITPVALGGVDASVSYATDARANADRVAVVEIPAWAQPTIAYWAATSPEVSKEARKFFDFIQSPDGQQVLSREGFAFVDAAAGKKP